jgi:hypothetical protein
MDIDIAEIGKLGDEVTLPRDFIQVLLESDSF